MCLGLRGGLFRVERARVIFRGFEENKIAVGVILGVICCGSCDKLCLRSCLRICEVGWSDN